MARSSRDFFGRRKDTYFQATHRPLTCLVFLLPLIIAYEIGSMTAGTLPIKQVIDVASQAAPHGGSADAPAPYTPSRVIAFCWIVQFLGLFTAVPTYLPGLLLVVVLALWHLGSERPGRFRWRTIGGMAVESFLFCLPLLVFYRVVQVYLLDHVSGGYPFAAGDLPLGLRERLVIALTAGIYEELIFRLLLIWMLKLLFVDLLEWPQSPSMAAIVVVAGVLFSGYHYLGPEHFQWWTFLFRAAAGTYLGMTYVVRGFGITVGTHSLYDVIATMSAGG